MKLSAQLRKHAPGLSLPIRLEREVDESRRRWNFQAAQLEKTGYFPHTQSRRP